MKKKRVECIASCVREIGDMIRSDTIHDVTPRLLSSLPFDIRWLSDLKCIHRVLFLLILLLFQLPSIAQNIQDSLPATTDSGHAIQKKKINQKKPVTDTVNKQITTIPVLHDSNLKKQTDISKVKVIVQKKVPDTLMHKDSLILARQSPSEVVHPIGFSKLISENRFLNVKGKPLFILEQPRHVSGKEFLFYCLCVVLLILGIFKTVFNGYFKNLFRVYFNTSLRQTQLSDQLEQAKLPSLILNIFFTITAGIYIWLLFDYYHPPRLINSKILLPFCIFCVAALYFIKFCLLKFMGWVTEIQQTTNKYIFAIFLVNKIIGIVLVPVIILLSFSISSWRTVITNGSFFIIGLFFLSRYFKSYSVLDKKVKINPVHFIIYIAGGEIIPLLLIYKIAIDYFI